MANIVELRDMDNEKLSEMIENGREELFNLRFQNASGQLENYARVKTVRREIAQLQSVLHMRDLAAEVASQQQEIASALANQNWTASARFSYEDSAWRVDFAGDDGKELANAMVNLNKSRPHGRKGRENKKQPILVTRYEIAG
jgi:large subunit ribosomal protein L29